MSCYTGSIRDHLMQIFKNITGHDITIYSENMFSSDIGVTPRQMAYVFLSIKDEFEIDINMLYHNFNEYTFDNLVKQIETLLEVKIHDNN